MRPSEVEELKDIFKALEEKGWQPMLCDTPVPFFDNPVSCGLPTDVGDVQESTTMLPKEFLSMQPEFVVKVMGDSMKDAGIIDGDSVKVVTGTRFHDGDIVLVMVDGEVTLKCYCEDEDGTPWLVPQNADYDAFPLNEQQNVWVMGIVTEIVKSAPRIKYRSCMNLINNVKKKHAESREISPLRISQAIREIAPMIEVARQWYAVYRIMVDYSIVKEDDFDGFIDMIKTEMPNHEHLPTRVELQRLVVQSFAKPVNSWKPGNAPVTGKRYNDYLKIAQKMMELLGV